MFFQETSNGYILRIKVTPNANKCGICGIYIDVNNLQHLKISLNSAPEKGKANLELIKFLSKLIKKSKSCFAIISGDTDKYKRISIATEINLELTNLLSNLAKEA